MVSTVDTTKIRAERAVYLERFIGTAGTMVSIYRSLTGVRNVLAGAALITKVGNGLTLVELVAAEDSAGTNATAIKTSGTLVADAVGTTGSVVPDQAFVEMSIDELKTLERTTEYTFTHFALRVTAQNAGDIIAGVIEVDGRFQYDDQTPASTIAA